jgi:hypothetical protein
MSLALPAYNWIYWAATCPSTSTCYRSDCGYRNVSMAGNLMNGISYRLHHDANATQCCSMQVHPEFTGHRFTTAGSSNIPLSFRRQCVVAASRTQCSTSSASLNFSIDEILRTDFGRHPDDAERRCSNAMSSIPDQRGTSGQSSTADKHLGYLNSIIQLFAGKQVKCIWTKILCDSVGSRSLTL